MSIHSNKDKRKETWMVRQKIKMADGGLDYTSEVRLLNRWEMLQYIFQTESTNISYNEWRIKNKQ